ncbi:hypothetical protein BD410DRAFT_133171 [Rickenella mellea]|uniref:Uncharacterized protein n=1 Tax=Rickenella mellea TaxID=50990 RepID=A0A4Y7Q8P7_9AGAM|nr:hypothetical protein BD410DRAFT_133171 [Rickenella mellea]
MATVTGDSEAKRFPSDDKVRVSQLVEAFEKANIDSKDEADSSDSEESEESQRLSTVTFLYERLVDKSKSQPVVFIGESDNRSMPIALAVLRGNLEGIWATSRLPVEPWTFSGFEELLEKQIAQAKINWELKKPPMSDVDRGKATKPFNAFKEYLANGDGTRVENLLERFVEGADATDLRSSFDGLKPTNNIWFQCPWPHGNDGFYPDTLLKWFVRSAAEVQAPGDVLIIGLTTHTDYAHKYKLEGFMEYATRCGYEHLVEDSDFIGQLLDLGYLHVGWRGADIHWKLFNYHVTHVFKKKSYETKSAFT